MSGLAALTNRYNSSLLVSRALQDLVQTATCCVVQAVLLRLVLAGYIARDEDLNVHFFRYGSYCIACAAVLCACCAA